VPPRQIPVEHDHVIVGEQSALKSRRPAGGLVLTDNRIVLPSSSNASLQPPTSVSVDGTDISHPKLGPLSDGRLTAGRTFTAADTDSDVAVVDSNYATANNLKIGSTVTIAKTKFKIIGIVAQPQASSPPEVYIPPRGLRRWPPTRLTGRP
jgi:putative ABC transport system permease protein